MPTYPTDLTTMRLALYTWVTGQLGVGWTVVHEPQEGDGRRRPAPPAKPFAKIQLLDVPQPEGRQFAQQLDASPTRIDMHVRNVAEMKVEVQLFADTDARGLAENLRASLDLQYPTLDALSVAGLVSIPSQITLKDMSTIFASENEFRYLLEVGFRVETRRTVADYPYIGTVNPLTVGVS